MLEIFEEREVLGKDFRIYGDIENPLFLAKDVAEWIEHSDVFMMLRTVDESEKLVQTVFVSGQNRNMWFLTEDGLHEVLMQSRNPITKKFKKEVKVILKSIRKHGAYMTLTNPDFIIQLATKLKEEQEKNNLSMHYVYFIENTKNECIKIGTSQNPNESLSSMQIANVDKLEIIKIIDGSYKKEKQLHELFKKYKVREDGEWFKGNIKPFILDIL